MGLKSELASSFPDVGLVGEFPRILIGLSVEPDLADKGLEPGEVIRDGRKRPFEVRRLSLLSEVDWFGLGSIALSDFDRNDRFIWLIFFILIVTRQLLYQKNGEHVYHDTLNLTYVVSTYCLILSNYSYEKRVQL